MKIMLNYRIIIFFHHEVLVCTCLDRVKVKKAMAKCVKVDSGSHNQCCVLKLVDVLQQVLQT